MNLFLLTELDPDVYKSIFFVFILLLVMRFLLSIIKKLLDHKLKNKIIEKGMSETITSALLQTETHSEISNNIKWFSILGSTGIGFFIVETFLPLGFHSIAIMAISISLGFLAHSFYLKTLDK